MTNQQTQCVIRKKGSDTIGNDSWHPAPLARDFLLYFLFLFPTGSDSGPANIQLQIHQKRFLLPKRRRALRRGGGNESSSGTDRTGSARIAHGHVVLLIGISREDSRRITNAIQSGDACTHCFWIYHVCLNYLLSLALNNSALATQRCIMLQRCSVLVNTHSSNFNLFFCVDVFEYSRMCPPLWTPCASE